MVPHGFTESALPHDTLKHVGGRLPGFKLVIKAWKWGRLFVLSARVHMSYSRQANCTMRKSEIKKIKLCWVLSKGRKTARAKKRCHKIICRLHRDKVHVDWVKAYISIWTALQHYIKEQHTTGLTWSKTVSFQRKEEEERKKIKKGNYCNLKHKKQLSNDQMQPDSWINTFTLGPVLLILCARANWSLALEKIVLSVLRVIRLHDFCSLPCCICISGTSFLVVHNEGKAGAFRVQNNPETELELCFC